VRRRLTSFVLATVLATTLLSGVAGSGVTPSIAGPLSVKLSLARMATSTTSLDIGVTHTQYSVDSWGNPAAVSSARDLLSSAPLHQNQHIMGWGALNPEPSPGVYSWTTLDRRIQLMLDTTETPTITLAGAPDWMKGGVAGTTDWSKIEVAPTPEHYDDFARLSATVAARYPDVKRFQVWNELKGFYDPTTNRWNAVAYTELYNKVYDAVKAVRPDALIGGPYVVMDSWASPSAGGFPSAIRGSWGIVDQRPLDVVTHWLAHKHGGDFLSVDGGSSTRDKGLIADPFTSAQKFAAVTTWLRAQTSLPVVWSEWYPRATSADTVHQAAVLAHSLITTAKAGAGAVLLWQPQCVAPTVHSCLFTDTRVAGGGTPTALWDVTAAFADAFPSGTRLYDVALSAPGVTAMASASTLLLVNTSATAVGISGVKGVRTLGPYEVRFLAR
jgi:hypothetical protein